MEPVERLLNDDAFVIAVLLGAGVAAAVVALRLALPGNPVPRRFPGLAAVVFVGFIGGLQDAFSDLRGFLLAVSLLALGIGGWLADKRPALRPFAAIPGAFLLLGAFKDVSPMWSQLLAVGVTIVAAPLAAGVDRRLPRLTGPLLAVSVLGAYATVPITEHAAILLGGIAPAVLFVLDRRTPTAAGGVSMAVGAILWTAAYDGFPRPGAIVGAAACVGVLALAWPIRRLTDRSEPTRGLQLFVFVVHVGLVLFASRVAGLREDAWVAAVLAAVGFIVAAAVLLRGASMLDARRRPA